jgi:hypothetical protein
MILLVETIISVYKTLKTELNEKDMIKTRFRDLSAVKLNLQSLL